MKSAILAVLFAAGVGGVVSSSDAQEAKKLQPHPAAAADQSLRQSEAELPSSKTEASYTGEAGGMSAAAAKPKTGDPVASGGSSTAYSKQNN